MAQTTANGVLWPEITDTVHVSDDLKNMALSIDPQLNAPTITVYTSNDTWTKPANLKWIRARLVGGGGGSGGIPATDSSHCGSAGGGGGGGYSEKIILAASLGTTETVTVGAAGTGAAAGYNTGGTGGTSSFGAHCSATGGVGGQGSLAVYANTQADISSIGGFGGTGSGGDINIVGSQGGNAFVLFGDGRGGGEGGSSVLGGSVSKDQDPTGSIGMTGRAYGGGASGSVNPSSHTNKTGAAGAAGVVIVENHY